MFDSGGSNNQLSRTYEGKRTNGCPSQLLHAQGDLPRAHSLLRDSLPDHRGNLVPLQAPAAPAAREDPEARVARVAPVVGLRGPGVHHRANHLPGPEIRGLDHG